MGMAGDVISEHGLLFLGSRLKRLAERMQGDVAQIVEQMMAALEPDEIVIGGGNAKKLKELPPHCRLGDNANAFLGGFRLWKQEDSVPRASRPEVRSRKN